MFEMIFLMVAVAAHSVPEMGVSSTSSVVVRAPLPLIPEPGSEPRDVPKVVVVPPAFLTPAPAADPAAVAPPAFLSPADKPALVAEPQVPMGKFTTATEVKPILNATRNNWIHVREFDGKDFLYVTHLWSWRCGLLELRVGINGNDPEPWPLPPCHMDQPMPSVMLDSDGVPYQTFNLGSIAMVEVHITYDDLSTDGAKFNRQGVAIQ